MKPYALDASNFGVSTSVKVGFGAGGTTLTSFLSSSQDVNRIATKSIDRNFRIVLPSCPFSRIFDSDINLT